MILCHLTLSTLLSNGITVLFLVFYHKPNIFKDLVKSRQQFITILIETEIKPTIKPKVTKNQI